ncbi:hypothetical protein MMC11_005660 [Xylographa trunciseda]|nr:hypothetical protein [Xylographa trunciseda]
MKDMAELQLWKLEKGETAYQHFATNTAMVELLSEHCIGKKGVRDFHQVVAAKRLRSRSPWEAVAMLRLLRSAPSVRPEHSVDSVLRFSTADDDVHDYAAK